MTSCVSCCAKRVSNHSQKKIIKATMRIRKASSLISIIETNNTASTTPIEELLQICEAVRNDASHLKRALKLLLSADLRASRNVYVMLLDVVALHRRDLTIINTTCSLLRKSV